MCFIGKDVGQVLQLQVQLQMRLSVAGLDKVWCKCGCCCLLEALLVAHTR